ncbi:MAG: polynucleotide kinase-phosphatase [Chloroflexota bacterium]
MIIKIPELSLVVLIGPSGSGKSTFAEEHFKATEVISSDFCRGLVSDDENDQTSTKDAFEVLNYIAAKRLKNGRLTVIDATNVQQEARKPLVRLAREYHYFAVAIILDLPEKVCWERTKGRPDRTFGRDVIRRQMNQFNRSKKRLKREGFRYVFSLSSQEEIDQTQITLTPLWNNLKHEHGPFDIIGDLHGCADELEILLDQLGYNLVADPQHQTHAFQHSEGRKAVFLGDLMDRGPRNLDTYQIVRAMVRAGSALCVPGNHDTKLLRKLDGREVKVAHGLQTTLDEIEALPEENKEAKILEMRDFIRSLISHYVLDDGKLVVAHAGMKNEFQGRGSGKIRDFALYGETTGETDEFGLPVRHNWASEYRGDAMVVYGHTPVPEPKWLNRTINIDTGCVFGGSLTALRYPEKELVSVSAKQVYQPPVKPFLTDNISDRADEYLLNIEDVSGKRVVATRLRGNITIREENAIAALEVISRFAVDPKWLIYLPPTMSPSKTSNQPGYLEHPEDALSYYSRRGVQTSVCQQKHMGSRAVVIVCRDAEVAETRFGIQDGSFGVCYTRTGRRFFTDLDLEFQFLERIRQAVGKAGWWDKFETDWVCLDCELMPWSAKAQDLLRTQYAAVGAASLTSLNRAVELLNQSVVDDETTQRILSKYRVRLSMAELYTNAYRQYCWPVSDLTDYKLAPFHLLATEGAVHVDEDHLWHMEELSKLCQVDQEFLFSTPYRQVDLSDPISIKQALEWWEEITDHGLEGMVVKPINFIQKGSKGLLQPAIKSRGREYLRIIYGLEYTIPENLDRLRSRNLSRKRSLALREFSLGIESLERFVRREPLYKVHECVFGVLAMESEPVDPRL